MKSLVAAIAFLTRFPAGKFIACDTTDVARSAGWFPLVGLMLGTIYYLTATIFRPHLTPAVIAVLLVILDAVATGALHFDGLADSADGFGGGQSPEDVLRIMRDHTIGSYGGVAIAALVALKVTAYASILTRNNWAAALILTPALGRWSILLLTAALPYARSSPSAIGGMGKRSLFLGTAILLAALAAARSGRGFAAAGVVAGVSVVFGYYCRRRIAGITGDTLGANLQLCESTALLVFMWTAAPR